VVRVAEEGALHREAVAEAGIPAGEIMAEEITAGETLAEETMADLRLVAGVPGAGGEKVNQGDRLSVRPSGRDLMRGKRCGALREPCPLRLLQWRTEGVRVEDPQSVIRSRCKEEASVQR
jgi:hypothetical protein